MHNNLRLYVEAVITVATMVAMGVISGMAAAATTGDREIVITAVAAGFILSGSVLMVRLRRFAKKPALPSDPSA